MVLEPTVLTDVNHEMLVMRGFGPIIGIQKVASDEEAIALMNDALWIDCGRFFQESEPRDIGPSKCEKWGVLLELL